jgi:hypothetical protein
MTCRFSSNFTVLPMPHYVERELSPRESCSRANGESVPDLRLRTTCEVHAGFRPQLATKVIALVQ